MLNVIPNADDFLAVNRFVDNFVCPIAAMVAEQAKVKGYAIVVVGPGERKAWQWSLYGRLVRKAGWREACAVVDNVLYFLYVPRAEKEFKIVRADVSDTEVWLGLLEALGNDGFEQVEATGEYYQLRSTFGTSFRAEVVASDDVVNPFPQAQNYLAVVRENAWLPYLADLVSRNAKLYGYALIWANGHDLDAHKEKLEAALLAFADGGWLVTKICRNDRPYLLLFTPEKASTIRLFRSTPEGSCRCLLHDDRLHILVALNEQGFDMLDANDHYLEFEKRQ